jgi:hypothetical protein
MKSMSSPQAARVSNTISDASARIFGPLRVDADERHQVEKVLCSNLAWDGEEPIAAREGLRPIVEGL